MMERFKQSFVIMVTMILSCTMTKDRTFQCRFCLTIKIGTDGLGDVLPLSLRSISKSSTSEFVLLLHAHMLYKSKNSSIS